MVTTTASLTGVFPEMWTDDKDEKALRKKERNQAYRRHILKPICDLHFFEFIPYLFRFSQLETQESCYHKYSFIFFTLRFASFWRSKFIPKFT